MFDCLKKYIKCDISFNRYVSFINNKLSLNRNLEIYEKHHIIPRSMGGNNDPNNIIKLSLREHYIAHLLLLKTFKNKEMAHAFISMSGRNIKFNSRLYERYKMEYISNISGKNAYWYGKKHSQETINKLKSYKGVNNHMYGKKHTLESKIKMSNETSGNKNSMYNKFNVIDNEGNIYISNKNDPKYLSGEVSSIHKNKIIVKDKDGNSFQVDKNDPRYLSGELVGITKGKLVAKDKNGNRYYIDKFDERYLSGDLIEKNARSCNIENKFYFNLKNAAKEYNISLQTLCRRLRSEKDEWLNWKYIMI